MSSNMQNRLLLSQFKNRLKIAWKEKKLAIFTRDILTLCLAFIMLSFYLVPGSLFSQLAWLHNIPIMTEGASCRQDAVIVSIASLIIWSCFWTTVKNNEILVIGWLIIFVYLSIYSSSVLIPHLSMLLIIRCSRILLCLTVGLFVARLCQTSFRTLEVMSVVGTCQALYALYFYLHAQHLVWSGTIARAGGTFGDPNSVSLIMMFCIPLALSIALRRNGNTITSLLYVIFAALMLAVLIITWERAAVIGLTCGLIWFSYRFSGNFKIVAAMCVAMIILSIIVFHERSNSLINQISTEGSNQGRIILWHRGLNVFYNHWLIGIGPGLVEIPVIVRSGRVAVEKVFIEPKNLYIFWLAQSGICGVLFLMYLFASLTRIIQRTRLEDGLGVGAAWIGVLVVGLFETPFGVASQGYANVLVGALLGATIMLRMDDSGDLKKGNGYM